MTYNEIKLKYPDRKDPNLEKKRLFLLHYQNGLDIKNATAAAMIGSHKTVYKWLSTDLEFSKVFEEIKNETRENVIGYIYSILASNPNPLLLKRILDSKLFAHSEYRAIRPVDYADETDVEEVDNDITLEI